ncbi:hypothetical protein BH09ACT5_BH09ACT5_14370 [soil metagenome]
MNNDTANDTATSTSPHERAPRPSFWLRAIEHRKNVLTREYRRTLGDAAREGVSDEDYATTMATLEKMARNLGWDDSQRPERGFGPERRFGRGHGPHGGFEGFGMRGFGPWHPEHRPAGAPGAEAPSAERTDTETREG